MGYIVAILVVITAGWALLVGRRRWLERRDAARTAATGGAWRFRYELPLDAGPPYNYFDALSLGRAFDTKRGTDQGFEVAYFTVGEGGGRHSSPIKRPAAIVEVSVEHVGGVNLLRSWAPALESDGCSTSGPSGSIAAPTS